MEGCQEIPKQTGLSSYLAWESDRRRTGIWSSGAMGTPPEETLRKLALITPSGKNWVYTFEQLNNDAQYAPSLKKGHLSTMINGAPSRNACGHLHHLEVHQLLECKDWVVYPEGLNGNLEPVITPYQCQQPMAPPHLKISPKNLLLSKSLWGTTSEGPQTQAEPQHQLPILTPIWKVLPRWTVTLVWLLRSGSCCLVQSWTLPARVQGYPPQGGWYLWPWGPSVPKGKTPKPIATFSLASPQAIMPDDNELPDQTPKGTHRPTKGLGAGTGILPKEVNSLQEEMNRAMECLLMTRSSLDDCQRKQVSDFQAALHQN